MRKPRKYGSRKMALIHNRLLDGFLLGLSGLALIGGASLLLGGITLQVTHFTPYAFAGLFFLLSGLGVRILWRENSF